MEYTDASLDCLVFTHAAKWEGFCYKITAAARSCGQVEFQQNSRNDQEELDEIALETKIRKINPSMVVLVLCYSQILFLKFLLERTGLFPEIRLNRELSVLSKGQILTLNTTQKEFIEALANIKFGSKNVFEDLIFLNDL